MTAQLSRERLEALANLQSLECMALPASHAESAEMARMMLAGMDSEPVAVPGHADCCPECGSKSLTWDVAVAKTSDVVQGRLRTSDVTGMFFLGCDECSETVSNVRMEDIAIFLNDCRAAMLKAGPVTAVAVPEGWKLVPVEPTDAMCDIKHVGVDVCTGLAEGQEYYSICGEDARRVYRAMLAAAPEQEV